MAKIRIGVAIGRRAASLVAVAGERGNSCNILFQREVERGPGISPTRALDDLLNGLPEDLRGQDLRLALSSGDLACDDVWNAPGGVRSRDLTSVAPVLVEARSTGDTLEQLSIDVLLRSGQFVALALSLKSLAEIREVVRSRGLKLRLVTSLSAALADVLLTDGRLEVRWAGQRIHAERVEHQLRWTSFPWDKTGDATVEPLTLAGHSLPPGPAAAGAVALADPEVAPDALRGAPDAPRTLGERFRVPIRGLAAASALLLVAVGLFARSESTRFRAELAAAEQVEQTLMKRHFADRPPQRGELLRLVKERLRDSGQGGPGEVALPSAFQFWMDLGKHLPEVEAMGLGLETLDISPEGGRLSAVVATVPGDALRNAALLEAKLGESSKLSARGDFEARERDVQVRLKIDYRSR